MAILLKGAPVAKSLNEKTASAAEKLRARGTEPTLAMLRVGEREDDIAYERGAMKRCASVGVAVRSVVLPADVTQEALMAELYKLNADKNVHGILVFRPLPKQLDDEAVRAALLPEKDVDGITDASLAGVFTGSGTGYPPCTAQACVEMLDYYGVDCGGKRAAVIGRSLVVGRPAAMLLMAKNATVTICHTGTKNVPSITREADIVVVAAGKMETVGSEFLSPGQTVLDVGIGWSEAKGKLCGDVKFDEAEPLVAAISPVPGGIGSVTSAILVSHVTDAAGKLSQQGDL